MSRPSSRTISHIQYSICLEGGLPQSIGAGKSQAQVLQSCAGTRLNIYASSRSFASDLIMQAGQVLCTGNNYGAHSYELRISPSDIPLPTCHSYLSELAQRVEGDENNQGDEDHRQNSIVQAGIVTDRRHTVSLGYRNVIEQSWRTRKPLPAIHWTETDVRNRRQRVWTNGRVISSSSGVRESF